MPEDILIFISIGYEKSPSLFIVAFGISLEFVRMTPKTLPKLRFLFIYYSSGRME